ncbi:hypothetical protein EJB05_18520, partial [Eragrostis curvula]
MSEITGAEGTPAPANTRCLRCTSPDNANLPSRFLRFLKTCRRGVRNTRFQLVFPRTRRHQIVSQAPPAPALIYNQLHSPSFPSLRPRLLGLSSASSAFDYLLARLQLASTPPREIGGHRRNHDAGDRLGARQVYVNFVHKLLIILPMEYDAAVHLDPS